MMKAFAATVLLGVATVEARKYSANAVRVVTDIRNHFEKTFGEGLTGMLTETGELHPKAMSRASRTPRRLGAEWVKVGGVSINGEDTASTIYGLAQGFQYKGLNIGGASTTSAANLVESNCFYSMYGMMESVDQLLYDFDNMVDPSGEVLWFNMVFYNPITIFNNVSVGYEMCDVYQQFDKLSGMFSADWALIGDYIATDVTYFLTDPGLKAVTNMTSLITCGASDGITDTVTSIAGTVSDTVNDVNSIANGDVPSTESGWDTAVADGVNTAENAAGAVGDAAKVIGDAAACKPNFYKIGIQTGEICSVAMKQTLQEAKLP